MKRNLFAELMEGVAKLADQHKAQVPVREVETEVLLLTDISAKEINAHTEASVSETP